jgi:hypothetical protein
MHLTGRKMLMETKQCISNFVSMDEMKFYLMMSGWILQRNPVGDSEWVSPTGIIAYTTSYAYVRQRGMDGF